MHAETTFLLLFVVATGVAIVARRLRVPYTVALVGAGLALGAVHVLGAVHLTRELLFAVVLPGLLFDAAFHLEFREFWHNRVAITTLAVPGVVAAIALTAALLAPLVGGLGLVPTFGWQPALVFAALIAATDPIAVVGMFKSLGAPKRLAVLMEGESLFNDGTAIVFFTLILAFVSGSAVSPGALVKNFVLIVGAGAVIGAVVGMAASELIRRIDDPMIEITLTTVAAYGSFLAAEQFHFSGVIATVTAGMLAGNYGARTGMSPSTRIAVETFWEYVAFALNSLVFLLIGLEVSLSALARSWPVILLAYAAVLVGRGTVIAAVSALLARTRERVPAAWAAVLTWGGLRGALSMVLVLGIPRDFALRGLLATMTFGVVVLSILLNGLTMGPLLRRLGIVRAHEARAAFQLWRGRLQAANAGLRELAGLERAQTVDPEVARTLRVEYEARVERAQEILRALHVERKELHDDELYRTRRQLLLAEREQLIESLRAGLLAEEGYEQLLGDVDARLARLQSGDLAAPPPPEPREGVVPAATRGGDPSDRRE